MVKRTKSGLPRYCSYNTDRHGKQRVRFRKNGFSTYLTATPWSEDFMRQYGDALAGVKAQKDNIGESRTKPGSISALIVQFYRAPEFRGLSASTQRTYRGIYERFRETYGAHPVRRLERSHVKAIIGGMSDRPQAANNLLLRLKALLNFAVDLEIISANPALGVRGYKIKSSGFHSWREDEIATFERRHPIGTKARLAFCLQLYTA